METQDKIEQLEREIKQKEALIEAKRKEILKLILGIEPCRSHIYKSDLWGVQIRIFCGMRFKL